MRRVRHLGPCQPAARLATTNPLERQPPVRFGRSPGRAGAPTWTPSVTPTGSRPICEEFPARQVKSALHLDNGHTGRFGPLPHEPTAGQGPLRCISTTKTLAHRFTS